METKVLACLLMIPLVSSSSLPYHGGEGSQVLGILKQADVAADKIFPDYIADLWPEMIAASSLIGKSDDVVDTLMAYMPFARKIMAGQSGGKLTAEQEKLLGFTEKVVPPMMRFVQGIYGGSSFNDLAQNATPDYEFTNVMLKMLPDISEIINQMKSKYGGWPGTDKSLEIVNAFMPLARKATYYQAEAQGRQVTKEEEKYLTFAERVVPSLLEYAQSLYYKNLPSGQEYKIEQLVKSAVEDLHKTANRASIISVAGHRVQSSYKAPTPAVSPAVAYVHSSGLAQRPGTFAHIPSLGLRYA